MTVTECAIQVVFNINLNRATGGNRDYTAALTVMLTALQLISLPLNGLGNGVQPFVSYNFGKGDEKRLKTGIKYVTVIGFCFCLCIWSVSMLFPQIYAAAFSASGEVRQIVKDYCPLFLMGSIMFFVQMTLQNVNVALGQAKLALALAVNRKVIILIPLLCPDRGFGRKGCLSVGGNCRFCRRNHYVDGYIHIPSENFKRRAEQIKMTEQTENRTK